MSAYYDEKQKTWYCKFRYTDWQGNSKSTSKRGFRTKKEALRYEQEQKTKLKECPSISLESLSVEYLADYKIRYKPSSFLATEKNLRKYILPSLGKLPVKQLSPLVIRKWQNSLTLKNLSDSLLYSINITLSSVLTYAVKFHGLPSNPMRKTGRQGKITKRIEFIELDEWKKLDSVIDNIYFKTVLNLLYWTGMRIGELMGLTAKDIDTDSLTITINKQYFYGEIIPPKTSQSIRTVTLPPFLLEVYKKYINSLLEIPTPLFAIYDRKTITKYLQKYCLRAGIKPISPHALRHSHATLLINQGVPINAIAERLGHTPAMTLNIYAHCYKTQGKDIANALEKINVGQM